MYEITGREVKDYVKNYVERMRKVCKEVNKDYILSESSPEFLKRNRDLILKTIKMDCKYLNQVADDILLEELSQQSLPINGIIDTAFKSGYQLIAGEFYRGT